MKKLVYLLLLGLSWGVHAQLVRPFLEVAAFRETDFKNESYLNFEAGMEVRFFSFLKPELHIGYASGDLEYQTNTNQGTTIDLFERKVSATNYSFIPKIVFNFSDELLSAGDIQLQILPIYRYSSSKATGYYTLVNQSNPSKSITEKQTQTANQHSLGIGIGADIQLSDKNNDSLSLNLYYSGVAFGAALDKLNHQYTPINTNGSFGFGIAYYFGFKKKPEQN